MTTTRPTNQCKACGNFDESHECKSNPIIMVDIKYPPAAVEEPKPAPKPPKRTREPPVIFDEPEPAPKPKRKRDQSAVYEETCVSSIIEDYDQHPQPDREYGMYDSGFNLYTTKFMLPSDAPKIYLLICTPKGSADSPVYAYASRDVINKGPVNDEMHKRYKIMITEPQRAIIDVPMLPEPAPERPKMQDKIMAMPRSETFDEQALMLIIEDAKVQAQLGEFTLQDWSDLCSGITQHINKWFTWIYKEGGRPYALEEGVKYARDGMKRQVKIADFIRRDLYDLEKTYGIFTFTTMVNTFKMDGKNEIGSITNYDSIIHDGQEMGRGKSAYTFETLGLFYQSLVDTGKPINAEVFSKLHGNKTRLLQVK